MNNLLAAIMAKTVGSALSTAVGGRIYLDEAPEGATYPYVVFRIVASTPADTFAETIDDTLIQFSLFSSSQSATEITGLYANLTTLLDGATLTVTGGTNLRLQRESLTTLVEDHTTLAGTIGVKHWAVDYAILVQET